MSTTYNNHNHDYSYINSDPNSIEDNNTDAAAGAAPTTELPIDPEKKAAILLSIEESIKTVLLNLAKHQAIDGTGKPEARFSHLPNSITGVVVYFITEGLKQEFGISFQQKPVSLKHRGGTTLEKKINGKKRLLTREEKNKLLSQTQMAYYEQDIANGILTIEEAVNAIAKAFNRKRELEAMGYILPAKKTEYPYWADSKGKESQTSQ